MTKITAVRTATHWEAVTDVKGRHVMYIHGNEGTSVCLASIQDQASDAPARRIVAGADQGIAEDELVGSGKGLTVYGQHKFDRPSLSEAMHLDAEAARAIIGDCVRRGIGYDHPLICEAVRKHLGLSQADIGILMGMAAGNSDSATRRRNVGRTVRKYESDGAPTMYAQALRWIAWRNGVLTEPHCSV